MLQFLCGEPYLHQQHAGHGVTFATGTPISNTMVEMYTMQRFLDPEGLRQRGLEHFDAWAASRGVDQRIIDDFVGHQTEEQRRRYRTSVSINATRSNSGGLQLKTRSPMVI